MKSSLKKYLLFILILPALMACQNILSRKEQRPIVLKPLPVTKLLKNIKVGQDSLNNLVKKQKTNTKIKEVYASFIKSNVEVEEPLYKEKPVTFKSLPKVTKKSFKVFKKKKQKTIEHYGFILDEYPEHTYFEKKFINYNLLAKLELLKSNKPRVMLALESKENVQETKAHERVEDIVTQIQSAKEKEVKTLAKNEIPKDELVFFDYESEKKSEEKPLLSTPILAAIEREMGPISKVLNKKIEKPVDYAALINNTNEEAGSNTIKLVANELKFNLGYSNEISKFSYVPAYARGMQKYPDPEGILKISWKGQNRRELYGTIKSQGYVRTRFQTSVETSQEFLEIPLISQNELERFLIKEDQHVQNGIVLVEMDNQILDIDLDTQYSDRYFLTENLKKTEKHEEAKYLMFLNVLPGNVMIKALTHDDSILEKIVHIAVEEIFYEKVEIKEEKNQIFSLYEKDVLASTKRELPLEKNKIKVFNKEIYPDKLGLNKYSIKYPTTLNGWRRYLSFGHLEDNIFVGASNVEELVIPTQDYIENVMQLTDLETLEGVCVVHVEANRGGIEDVELDGETIKGPMDVRSYFIDDDGSIGEEPSQNSTRFFLIGESGGMISAKINYTDGESEILNTYCSESTYLLEHL